jgi:hypothetical protein
VSHTIRFLQDQQLLIPGVGGHGHALDAFLQADKVRVALVGPAGELLEASLQCQQLL